MPLKKFNRLLDIKLPPRQSAFLWGARKTGKTTYLKQRFVHSVFYDLLKTDEYFRLLKTPSLLRQEILELKPGQLKKPVIIDEIQKIPSLLDEVHWCIENTEAQFILCGSSARKLKTLGSNLLGGRAWRYALYPLVYFEIPQFDLLHAFNTGLIPSHYLNTAPLQALEAYLVDYMTHEIQAEGLTRNLPAFARFLDSLIYSHGELVNFSNVARDCGVDAKTVREYYQILVDTLLGYWLLPYHARKNRKEISETPKFYLLDVGLVNFIKKQTLQILKGSEAGKSFEHFILMEILAYLRYSKRQQEVYFWRTTEGHEVDFVLGKADVAIEVKIDSNPDPRDFRGLIQFCEAYKPRCAIVVCTGERARQVNVANYKIRILPWKVFLEELWEDQLF